MEKNTTATKWLDLLFFHRLCLTQISGSCSAVSPPTPSLPIPLKSFPDTIGTTLYNAGPFLLMWCFCNSISLMRCKLWGKGHVLYLPQIPPRAWSNVNIFEIKEKLWKGDRVGSRQWREHIQKCTGLSLMEFVGEEMSLIAARVWTFRGGQENIET